MLGIERLAQRTFWEAQIFRGDVPPRSASSFAVTVCSQGWTIHADGWVSSLIGAGGLGLSLAADCRGQRRGCAVPGRVPGCKAQLVLDCGKGAETVVVSSQRLLGVKQSRTWLRAAQRPSDVDKAGQNARLCCRMLPDCQRRRNGKKKKQSYYRAMQCSAAQAGDVVWCARRREGLGITEMTSCCSSRTATRQAAHFGCGGGRAITPSIEYTCTTGVVFRRCKRTALSGLGRCGWAKTGDESQDLSRATRLMPG